MKWFIPDSRDCFNRRFNRRIKQLGCAMVTGALLVACRTAVQEESFSKPFDTQRVAQLSHEAFEVAFDATSWARHDLRVSSFKPTPLDHEAVRYLNQISQRVGLIGLKAENNPATPRVSSKAAYDNVAYDTMMFQRRYEPSSFKPSTNAKIEHLLKLLDEMATYYAQKSGTVTARSAAVFQNSGPASI